MSALPADDKVDGRMAGHRATGVESRDTTLLDALGVAVYTTDRDGHIQRFNDPAVELWGRRPVVGEDQFCGSWKLYFPDGAPMRHDECPMATSLREGRPVRGGEAIAERPDGRRIPFMAFPTPMLDDHGNVTGAVNVLIDITDRKAAEAQLKEQEELLVDALAARDEFLGLVSHELRTPITVIMGNAEILARQAGTLAPEDRASATADVYEQSVHLNRLVDDLLTISRLEQGLLEREPVALLTLIEALAAEPDWRGHIRVSHGQGAGELFAEGDDHAIREVLRHYLRNARDVSAAGSTIDLALDREGDEAIVRVLDRGPGIDADETALVFEPFYRARREPYSGLGMGLAVCRRLIESLGGRVWARPRTGGGSEFGLALVLTGDDNSD
jgi:PAS domain S-box-containing protein